MPWTTLFLDLNTSARDAPWQHAVMTGYADYGAVVFVELLTTWRVARRRTTTAMVAALWAPIAAG